MTKVEWRVLPTQANRDMEQAGADAAREYLERNGHNNLWVIYEAMTAAAPKPPASTEAPDHAAELAKAKILLHTASVHLSRWVGMDDSPRQQIIEFLEDTHSPVESVERAAFEAYATAKGWDSRHLEQRGDGGYEDWGVQPQWLAWQARAALDRTT